MTTDKERSTFGALNGVRTTLVIGAGICAVVALIFGYPIVTLVLGIGILAHGALWWWLWRQSSDQQSVISNQDPNRLSG